MNKFSFIKDFYVKNKIKIFPVHRKTKLPMIDKWQEECSCELPQIVYWLEKGDNCNFGMPANTNNLFILDLDTHNPEENGINFFKKLCGDLGIELPKTLTQTTPSGGVHYIFKSDEELRQVANSSNTYKKQGYPGIDVRTKGYIVVEPSSRDDGEYKFDMTYPISDMPKELRDFIINVKNTNKEEQKNTGYEKPEKVERGARDTEVFKYISYLYYNTKLEQDEILLLALNFNRNVCSPPMKDSDVVYKVKKAFEKERGKYILLRLSEEEK